ncbi:RNA 2',3'-cyclic phosphodiesterase [Allosalinactinospora lopnorensis]|uniref:RNA 2',3'-cyclic phosphodiesterase n=1 Tax=Allosalinactinospora lopnorensis TaxID=1352348 RepID=UPI000623BFE2|nr:RNA 2',3'-cyclic phosphodiesterase [Allosalinactinospora lopnorensis]
MRFFVAVDPPAGVLEEMEEAVAFLRPWAPALRWTEREDRHLTLLFLGEVPDERLSEIRRRFGAEVALHHPLSLVVRGTGTFPGDTTRARVLWAGIDGDVRGLNLLSYGLRRAARKAGINVQKRPYVPHLTLARSRAPADLNELRTRLDPLESTPFTATNVHLVHSRPGSRPRYRTVSSWPLF